ncbi:MAG: type II toxin-antitoxin system ParD family antitoxin [Alphaproteobacteria bacterium]|nr:type II toxin-antitoxin system ParD family antitoxin [Alphaproteobacteria bacterium]MBU0799134.1 type II toxin-antitoxin system ParD family antitoxin [Alphaproteobacteria bacterium]MBU0888837.1 type II toxin-antitoxin system ParD family antitoxin [Alphaproteobacteria bacterium]MBU1813857.1 type II toxin-antitoxin system ParD family antitoxin [Alphaproteobacteria bacterium]
MSTNVSLTPELERFARECLETGRYNSVSEVVRHALRLMQDAERRREGFEAMLAEARDEADSQGVHQLDEVLSELDEIIGKAR